MDVSGVKGTFNGKSFAAVSGFRIHQRRQDGRHRLQRQPDVCASVKQNKYHPNETWVPSFDLEGAGNGCAPVSLGDFKVFVADATCNVAYRCGHSRAVLSHADSGRHERGRG